MTILKLDELEKLQKEATRIYNSHPIETRRLFAISSASTQIQTLLTMKTVIQSQADSKCHKIDKWIANIAKDLKEYMAEIVESENE